MNAARKTEILGQDDLGGPVNEALSSRSVLASSMASPLGLTTEPIRKT
jgi:hypothetical protein